MDKETKGAWIIHHGRKIALHIGAASDYPALDESSKAAELLMRLGQTDQSVLTKPQAVAVARAANLNHRTELPHYLNILEKRKLIDISGENIAILGVTTRSVLAHANDILEDGEPNEYEQASLGLAELTSSELQEKKKSLEYISDTYHISNPDVKDFVNQSIELGFVDFEGDGEDGLLFNGNLFKRKTIVKTGKVLSSLSSEEEERVVEFSQTLQRLGCVHSRTADRILGETLFEKLKAAGFFD